MKFNFKISKRRKSQFYWLLAIVSALFLILFSTPNLKQPSNGKVQLVQHSPLTETNEIAQKVENLLSQMTLPEKVGQMTQITLQAVSKTEGKLEQKYEVDPRKLREAITKYHIGSILNVHSSALSLEEWQQLITQIQDLATKETRLGIPILYGIDAIHGANYTSEATLFPQNLASSNHRL